MPINFPDSPVNGDEIFIAGNKYVYDGTTWSKALKSSNISRYTYTATSGQTTFNASYDAGYVDVFLNGIKLDTSEFTASNGTTVVLNVGATTGDIVEIAGYNLNFFSEDVLHEAELTDPVSVKAIDQGLSTTNSPTFAGGTFNGGISVVSGESNFGGADATNCILNIGAGATGNKFALTDYIGDNTYTDFGLRVGRSNTGANGSSVIQHRGTGAITINAIDAGVIELATNNLVRQTIDASGNATFVGNVSFNGFNSSGANLHQWGDQATNANFVVERGRDDSTMIVSGGSASSTGSNLYFYGGTHATHPNEFRIRQLSTNRLIIEDTAGNGNWRFKDTSGNDSLTIDGSNSSTTLEAGALGKAHNLGNLATNTTLSIANGNVQYATATGAFTLTAPNDTNQGYIDLELTMDATGGYAIVLSGFNEVAGTLDTAANVVNILRISKLNTNTYLEILQAV